MMMFADPAPVFPRLWLHVKIYGFLLQLQLRIHGTIKFIESVLTRVKICDSKESTTFVADSSATCQRLFAILVDAGRDDAGSGEEFIRYF